MRTLLLTNFGAPTHGGGRSKGRWPAALADCTGLRSLRLHGNVNAGIPSGHLPQRTDDAGMAWRSAR